MALRVTPAANALKPVHICCAALKDIYVMRSDAIETARCALGLDTTLNPAVALLSVVLSVAFASTPGPVLYWPSWQARPLTAQSHLVLCFLKPCHVHILPAPAVSRDTRTPTACSFTPWVHLHGVMLQKWWLESNPQWQQLVKQWSTPLGGSAGGDLWRHRSAQLSWCTLLSAAG